MDLNESARWKNKGQIQMRNHHVVAEVDDDVLTGRPF